ncbi:unnamed protein product, partial [Mesorhabditis spiculigera]
MRPETLDAILPEKSQRPSSYLEIYVEEKTNWATAASDECMRLGDALHVFAIDTQHSVADLRAEQIKRG